VARTLFDTLSPHDRDQLRRILGVLVEDGDRPHTR
jgi:hypothetical protein